jgi:hypothetical protein
VVKARRSEESALDELIREVGEEHVAVEDDGARAPIMRTSTGDAASPASDDILAAAQRLRCIVRQVSTEEFRWQDAHYDRDSRFGRELLSLIANNDWARATF